MRSGIVAGGNWIVDQIKEVEAWPEQDTLATITHESTGNGGSAYNVLVNLSILGATFPLSGIGMVGDDARGRAILDDCRARRIDVTRMRLTDKAPTSYTDVINVRPTGRRTFFHQRGANALLDPDCFDFGQTEARLFHLGYLLLLDRLDELKNGCPRAVDVLQSARRAGLMTSVDLVSENAGRFEPIARHVLPEVDVLFANDFETEKLTGTSLRTDGAVQATAVEHAAQQLLRHGVRGWVVIHFPEGVYAASALGQRHWQPSVRLPASEIAGAAGAGDAVAAAILLGLHEGWEMDRSLKLGIAAAAASLRHVSCSAGLRKVSECLALIERFGVRSPVH